MIIRSKSENDVYKWNMSYLLMMLFPNLKVKFKFKNRKKGEKFDEKFVEMMKLSVYALSTLHLSDQEKQFMKAKFWWIPGWYFDWYQSANIFDASKVKMWIDEQGEFQMEVEDYGYIVTFWETVLLPIFSENRNKFYGYTEMNKSEAMEILAEQVELSNKHQLLFSEFGLRRRFSAVWQDQVDDYLAAHAKYCVGNSNVYEAYRLGQPISGTQAHEIYMIYNAKYGYRNGNDRCVEDWQHLFNGNIGTLLCDTVGVDEFLRQLTTIHAKTCDGFRHDSGDWATFTTKIIRRLNELHVNPLHKSIIYSNSINMFDLDDIANNVRGRVGTVAGGIGGALTNNIPSLRNANPNCVMKVYSLDFGDGINRFAVKAPDEPGKYMGEPKEVEHALYSIGREDEIKLIAA